MKYNGRGGKLIIYQGWADAIVTPLRTVDYYNDVTKAAGGRANTEKFARLFMVPGMDHLPTLTQRFSELLLGALEELLELRYTRERAPLFAHLNLTLEKLRVLSRALKDRRALSITQYEFFNKELNEVGRMVGGWMKANTRKAAEGTP